MKKKIYLAVTVLLLTLAGIYVAARMILWGGPVSFRSYVLLLGDLLCLLLLLFYVYLRVTHQAAPENTGQVGNSREMGVAGGYRHCFVGSAVPDRHVCRNCLDLV